MRVDVCTLFMVCFACNCTCMCIYSVIYIIYINTYQYLIISVRVRMNVRRNCKIRSKALSLQSQKLFDFFSRPHDLPNIFIGMRETRAFEMWHLPWRVLSQSLLQCSDSMRQHCVQCTPFQSAVPRISEVYAAKLCCTSSYGIALKRPIEKWNNSGITNGKI